MQVLWGSPLGAGNEEVLRAGRCWVAWRCCAQRLCSGAFWAGSGPVEAAGFSFSPFGGWVSLTLRAAGRVLPCALATCVRPVCFGSALSADVFIPCGLELALKMGTLALSDGDPDLAMSSRCSSRCDTGVMLGAWFQSQVQSYSARVIRTAPF